jgi:protein-tyrosine phosphatase
MAAGFLRAGLADRGADGVVVTSCGISGWEGAEAVPEAIEAMVERGVDITGHRARRFDPHMARDADLILAMAAEHRDAVTAAVPEAAARTFTVKELARFLGNLLVAAPDGGAAGRPAALAAAADRLRASGTVEPSRDEDVADPLGLGIEAFRATAWEIEGLCSKILDAAFGSPAAAGAERPDGGTTRLKGGA